MARTFAAASSERVTLSLGALPTGGGDLTVVIICKSASDGVASRTPISIGSAAGARVELNRDSANVFRLLLNGGASSAPTITLVAADGWTLLAATHASGTTKPRFHKVPLAAGGTITHEDAAATLADFSALTTRAALGANAAATGFWDGDLAVCGVYTSVLSDQEIEALAASLAAWFKLSAKGIWVLDHSAVTLKVYDRSGGGANESARTGTTVSANSVPFWSYAADPILIHAAASGAVTVTPSVGVITLTGLAPSIQTRCSPSIGVVTLSGLVPAISTRTSPSVGRITLSGLTPSIQTRTSPAIGVITLTGLAPTIISPVKVLPAIGRITLTGLAPTIGGRAGGGGVVIVAHPSRRPSDDEALALLMLLSEDD